MEGPAAAGAELTGSGLRLAARLALPEVAGGALGGGGSGCLGAGWFCWDAEDGVEDAGVWATAICTGAEEFEVKAV
jgi:hypothetical protein